MPGISDLCLRCARFRGDGTCAAFPDGIPEEVFGGEHDHHEPFEGDGGLTFTPTTTPDADRLLAYPPDGFPTD
jgi:hypothetical protein